MNCKLPHVAQFRYKKRRAMLSVELVAVFEIYDQNGIGLRDLTRQFLLDHLLEHFKRLRSHHCDAVDEERWR